MTADRSLAEQTDHLYRRNPTPIYQGEGSVEETSAPWTVLPGLDISISLPFTDEQGRTGYRVGFLSELLSELLSGYEGSRVRVTIEDLGVPPYEPSEP